MAGLCGGQSAGRCKGCLVGLWAPPCVGCCWRPVAEDEEECSPGATGSLAVKTGWEEIEADEGEGLVSLRWQGKKSLLLARGGAGAAVALLVSLVPDLKGEGGRCLARRGRRSVYGGRRLHGLWGRVASGFVFLRKGGRLSVRGFRLGFFLLFSPKFSPPPCL